MTELPVLPPVPGAGDRVPRTASSLLSRKLRRFFVHGLRIALLMVIVACIRQGVSQTEDVDRDLQQNVTAQQWVGEWGATLKPFDANLQGNPVQAADGTVVGCLLQSFPESKSIVGYSGPTNLLIHISNDHKIEAVRIMTSEDTLEHVRLVQNDATFLKSFEGMAVHQPIDPSQVDTVSGATLTSHAILASVARRLGTDIPSIKFNQLPKTENVQRLFEDADTLVRTRRQQVYEVRSKDDQTLGTVLTTTPIADNRNGYQGPTATLVGFDTEGQFVGLKIDQTYDNEEYARYVDEDYAFPAWFENKSLSEIGEMGSVLPEIEGVSGATMTSTCVAEGIVMAAKRASQPDTVPEGRDGWSYGWDLITILLLLAGISLSFTSVGKVRWLRRSYQVFVVVFLGGVAGHILSQGLLIGWARNGIPWNVSPGLSLLGLAAFLVPMGSKHQPYCHQVCPFGVLQQWTQQANRKHQVRVGRKWRGRLKWLSGFLIFGLLAVAVLVGVCGSQLPLNAMEPFDAFNFRTAGWATLTIFIVGLLASLFLPMAYCRFGCPTGRVIGYFRFRATSDQLGFSDLAATLLALWAIGLLIWG